jgi:hypothetical protein
MISLLGERIDAPLPGLFDRMDDPDSDEEEVSED